MYYKNGYKCHHYLRPQDATNLVSQVTAKRKEDYNIIVPKLNEAKLVPKRTGQFSKYFIMVKKFQSFIPLLLINNKLVSNFKINANHCSAFFCFPLYPLRQT